MAMIVPPGGAAGFSQMTPASRIALMGGARSPSAPRRRRRKAARAAAPKKRRAGKRGGKMKFGSPAWQRKYKVGKFAKRRR